MIIFNVIVNQHNVVPIFNLNLLSNNVNVKKKTCSLLLLQSKFMVFNNQLEIHRCHTDLKKKNTLIFLINLYLRIELKCVTIFFSMFTGTWYNTISAEI